MLSPATPWRWSSGEAREQGEPRAELTLTVGEGLYGMTYERLYPGRMLGLWPGTSAAGLCWSCCWLSAAWLGIQHRARHPSRRPPRQRPPIGTENCDINRPSEKSPAEGCRSLRDVPTNHMLVEARINDKGPFRLIFDLGAPITLLNNRASEAAGVVKPDAPRSFLFGMRGEAEVTAQGRRADGPETAGHHPRPSRAQGPGGRYRAPDRRASWASHSSLGTRRRSTTTPMR